MVNEPTKKVSVSVGHLTELKKENKDLKEEVDVLWKMVRLQMRENRKLAFKQETGNKEEQV